MRMREKVAAFSLFLAQTTEWMGGNKRGMASSGVKTTARVPAHRA